MVAYENRVFFSPFISKKYQLPLPSISRVIVPILIGKESPDSKEQHTPISSGHPAWPGRDRATENNRPDYIGIRVKT